MSRRFARRGATIAACYFRDLVGPGHRLFQRRWDRASARGDARPGYPDGGAAGAPARRDRRDARHRRRGCRRRLFESAALPSLVTAAVVVMPLSGSPGGMGRRLVREPTRPRRRSRPPALTTSCSETWRSRWAPSPSPSRSYRSPSRGGARRRRCQQGRQCERCRRRERRVDGRDVRRASRARVPILVDLTCTVVPGGYGGLAPDPPTGGTGTVCRDDHAPHAQRACHGDLSPRSADERTGGHRVAPVDR